MTKDNAGPEIDAAALRRTAGRLRANILRMIQKAGSGHPGGSLSAIDIIAYLYCHHMRIDPANPRWEDRDRFVLSKGHCSPALYAAQAERGYFPEETLWTLRDIESPLQGHPDMKGAAGIDITTGSLGQGFSAAAGMALAAKVLKKGWRVYTMVGDGELQEGIVWEAAMSASHYHLDNLVAFVDNNRQQSDGFTRSIMTVEPIDQRWLAWGWDVQRIDGHDFSAIHAAVARAMDSSGRPHVIVADTVKGKGIREMEDNPEWHSRAFTAEQLESFLEELQGEMTA